MSNTEKEKPWKKSIFFFFSAFAQQINRKWLPLEICFITWSRNKSLSILEHNANKNGVGWRKVYSILRSVDPPTNNFHYLTSKVKESFAKWTPMGNNLKKKLSAGEIRFWLQCKKIKPGQLVNFALLTHMKLDCYCP